MLQVKRLAQESDDMFSVSVPVLNGRPDRRPQHLWFDAPGNNYVGKLFKHPFEICQMVLDKLSGILTPADREWWTNYHALMERVRHLSEFGVPAQPVVKKKREKMAVDRTIPPILTAGPSRQRKKSSKDNFDAVDEVEDEEEDDQFDGEEPEWVVEAITKKKVEDGVVYYWVGHII